MTATPRPSHFSQSQKFLAVSIVTTACLAFAVSPPGGVLATANTVTTSTPTLGATENPTSNAATANTVSKNAAGEQQQSMSSGYVLLLSFLATAGLFSLWVVFWRVAKERGESVTAILLNPSFFRVTTVMGVLAATVVLCLADKLDGKLTGAILTGIVGYVLGSLTGAGGGTSSGPTGGNPPKTTEQTSQSQASGASQQAKTGGSDEAVGASQ